MKTALICHAGAPLDREGLARWLASFSDYRGTIVLRETHGRMRKRVRREISRVGPARFLDVLAFRLYYRLRLAAGDRQWEAEALARLRERYPAAPEAPELLTASPNSREAEEFLRRLSPDIVIARCKTLLAERIFSIPATGTFVMHPGICPEYRNAHGCFWALATGDRANVGMTLLKIDRGVDTGPVFGYYRCDFDETHESHVRIQHRVVLDNLDAIAARLAEIRAGAAAPFDTTGRPTGTWGQPWLTRYLRIQAAARARGRAGRGEQPVRAGSPAPGRVESPTSAR